MTLGLFWRRNVGSLQGMFPIVRHRLELQNSGQNVQVLTTWRSQRQFRQKMKEWAFHKNIHSSSMEWMVSKGAERQIMGKETQFMYRGTEVDSGKLERYSKRFQKPENVASELEGSPPSNFQPSQLAKCCLTCAHSNPIRY